jgi:hypothetical protein
MKNTDNKNNGVIVKGTVKMTVRTYSEDWIHHIDIGVYVDGESILRKMDGPIGYGYDFSVICIRRDAIKIGETLAIRVGDDEVRMKVMDLHAERNGDLTVIGEAAGQALVYSHIVEGEYPHVQWEWTAVTEVDSFATGSCGSFLEYRQKLYEYQQR